MRKTVAGLIIAAAFFILLPSACAQTNLSIAAPTTVSKDITFAVDVNVSGVTNLYDFQFDLGFNPNILSGVGIDEGPFLSTGGSTFFIPGSIDNVGGAITFNADTLLGAVSGVSGSGTLFVFDFTALAPGTSNFTISNVILQNSTGAIINSTTTSGSVLVKGGAVTPEPSTFLLAGSAMIVLLGLAWRGKR